MSSNVSLSLANLSLQVHAEKEFIKTLDEECMAFLKADSNCTTEVSEVAESITDSDDFSLSHTLEDEGLAEDCCPTGCFGFNAGEHNDDDNVVINDDFDTLAAISSNEEGDFVAKLLKQRRGAQRSSKKWRRYLRPERVRMQPRTLAKLPHAAEVAETAAAEVAAAVEKKGGEDKQADAVRLRPFERMRDQFLEKHTETLRNHFWLDVDKAKLAKRVEDRFLSCMRTCGVGVADLILAYHGTRADNFASIFAKGFLIGGRGTPVVHGTAHGHGVYAGSADNPSISNSYSDGSIIVCAVIDVKTEIKFTNSEEFEHDPSYWTDILRIGRPRKRPSGFKALKAWSQPVNVGSVNHHSGFLVVPVSSQIVPIGTIRWGPPKRRKGVAKSHEPPCEESPDRKTQPIKKEIEEDVYWPATGNPNTTDTLQACSPASQHAVRVHRQARCRARQRRRCEGRCAKAARCLEFEET
mmetsp:Transcript_58115/g.109506  ORF Transcript_58115/g.109506 Transcript_58115/m.109506 type:complete len:467 (+) Transcript_58115:74-1474(+)